MSKAERSLGHKRRCHSEKQPQLKKKEACDRPGIKNLGKLWPINEPRSRTSPRCSELVGGSNRPDEHRRLLQTMASGLILVSVEYYTIPCYTLYFSILSKLFNIILYYTILYYTILCYIILYYTVLYYTILYYTILYCTILYYTILCYTRLD